MFKVLIACLDNWNTIAEMPFILQKGGCTVDVYCSPKSWLLASSYVNEWVECSADKVEYVSNLVDLAQSSKYEWIIIGDDPLLHLLNERLTDEELFCRVMPVANIAYRNVLSSKKALADFCTGNGIATPGYVTYNNNDDLEKIKNLNFPVINKIDFSWGGVDMFVSHTYEDFLANLDKLPLNQNILIQEFIQGREVPVEALFYGGELLVYASSEILTFDKGPFTYSTRRRYYTNDAIKPLLITLGKKLGLRGFVNITYLYNPTNDTYYLIEADARPNSWMPYGRFTGNDFSLGVKRIVSGDYVNGYKDVPVKKPSVEVALFHKDIRRNLWGNHLFANLRWIFNYKRYWRYLPFYDKKLTKKIFAEFREIMGHKLSKLVGKKSTQSH